MHLRNIRRQVILAAIVELLVAGLSVPEICAKAGVGYEPNVTPHDPDPPAPVPNEKVPDGDFWTPQPQTVPQLPRANPTAQSPPRAPSPRLCGRIGSTSAEPGRGTVDRRGLVRLSGQG